MSRSNLRPAERKVLEELITGKLRRPKHRPRSADIDMKHAFLALCVLDLEAEGWKPRDAAIQRVKEKRHHSYSTIEKALRKYGKLLKATDPQLLQGLRSAFK